SDVASRVRWIRPLAVKQENRQISAASTTSRRSCCVPRHPTMRSILSEKYISELRLRRQPSSGHPCIGEVAAAFILGKLRLTERKTGNQRRMWRRSVLRDGQSLRNAALLVKRP